MITRKTIYFELRSANPSVTILTRKRMYDIEQKTIKPLILCSICLEFGKIFLKISAPNKLVKTAIIKLMMNDSNPGKNSSKMCFNLSSGFIEYECKYKIDLI
jgi:hypothetical protein